MNSDVMQVTEAVRDAITRMPDGPSVPQIPFFMQWSTTGRHYLDEWVTDLANTLEAAELDLESAEKAGLASGGARKLEPALWRIDSAVDKLLKILGLTLGVNVLALNKDKNGVRFRLDVRELLAR